MLTLATSQMVRMQKDLLAPVLARFVEMLCDRLPRHTAGRSNEQLNTLCERGIARAMRCGMDSEYNCYVVVAAMLVLGSAFDAGRGAAWDSKVLQDGDMHQDVKAKLLELRTFFEAGTDIAPHGH